jgi:hypothetical protein
MNIHEAALAVGAEILQGSFAEVELSGGYTSDLLSDVMGHAQLGQILVTIQAHRNTVAVASLIGVPAIVICNGRPIPEDMVDAAREEGIALLRTELNQFEVSGRLFKGFGR